MIFVDTNYFLRLIVKDVQEQYLKAKEFFEEGAKGKSDLFSSTIVFFEICWVLSSLYNREKRDIVTILRSVLDMRFLRLDDKELLQKATQIYTDSSLSLQDSYNIVYAKKENATDFISFDKKLVKKYKILK